MDVVRSSALLS